MLNIKYFLVVHLLFSFCWCEISNSQKEKLLNGFLQYYNGLPSQVYHSQEGSLLNTQQVDDTTYQIEASVRVAEINNAEATKWLKCTATLKNSDNVVTVSNNNCEDAVEPKPSPETTLEAQVEVSEPTVERKPVQLDNEVQADTAITSGEQFIAIPRDQPSAPCVGCATHVNPQAAGVSDLANLGVRHLDLHEPAVKHSLENVIDVERQVQVVNGVRYILTLSIHFNNCTEVEYENCASSKICKITILVKPWVKLSNGGNYRAILANNCTEEWLFGENGEVLPEPSTGDNPVQGNTSVDPGDDDIKIKHNTDVQSQPNQEKILTDDDLKKIQDQIITYAQFQKVTESDRQSFTIAPETSDLSKQHVFKSESERHTENSIPVTEPEKTEHQAFDINLDKKKAIDEMLDFFDFSGFKPKTDAEDVLPRVRRSYDYDLQVLSLADDFHGIKNSIDNARFMYTMAQAMVDYLNEMDMEVKNRAVKNVLRAEEETENHQRFVYIQARVTIPCDKVECESKDVDTQICNGVLDCSNDKSPQILTTFCYNDNKESDYREDIREIALNDPVLRKMAEEAVKQIESESKSQYALRINKIVSAITQVTSGTLTKFSIIVENIKCNKSVSLPLRINCTVLEQLGTNICDVIIHERHWLKEKKMSYTCTDRPADMRISKSKKVNKNVTTEDPEILEMLQEAIQYLESQSEKANKQKIVSIKSISSQIIAGFLTNIEFVVGYTDCTDENYSRHQINKCELLKGEGLRSCKAQIWDRSWIMDGRQIEVSCDDATKNNEIENTRKKRAIDSPSDQEQRTMSKDSDFDYKQLANESLYKFMQSSPTHQHYEVVKVDKAEVKDVSRKLIKIDFSISPTDCLVQNDGTLSSSECEIVNPKNVIHCRSKILQNNWIDKKQYFVKCKIKYEPKKNVNEVKDRNPSDSKYYQLAEESLAKYLQDTGHPNHVVVRVEKVTTQVVSGLLTRIDFVISPKSQSVDDSKTVRCHSEILEKHWLGTKTLNVSCQMKQNLNKIDEDVKINLDDPIYMQIAVESLQKYIRNKPESNLVRVAFVDKVVRDGETLVIRFIASHAEDGDGDTLCFAKLPETITSKRELDVKCHFIGTIFRDAEIIEDDPNYYKYVQLADECVNNYLHKTNSSLYTLVGIESVTVEWDEGIKTIINFNLSPDSENSELTQGKHCVAEILQQPWLHKNKIIQDVQCELDKDLYRIKRRVSNVRVRRQLGANSKSQDPTDPRYRALAEESLRKYVVDSGIAEPLIVARVEKVTTQVVSGIKIFLDFLVTGSSDSTTIKCHSEVWEQAWLNKKEILTVTCQNDGHRSKRELVGGQEDQDPTEPQYRILAEESLQKYVVDSGMTQRLAVTRVKKVTTQVVSGTVTRIDFVASDRSHATKIKCHSKIWERPWLNKKQINVTCKNDCHRSKKGLSGGVSEELVGGQLDQDPTAPEYKALAEESLRKYVVDSGITQRLAVTRVKKVTTQVVSGTMTRIDFEASDRSHARKIKCHSEIWERPWLNEKEIRVTCGNDGHRSKKRLPDSLTEELVGGQLDQDPTKPQYRVLAEESLRKYVVDSGITQRLAVTRVKKVTTQVVSGTMTRIDFVASDRSQATKIKCHSKIWERPWLNKKQINVTCKNDVCKSKRGIPGGLTDEDPTAPQYKALAEESLRKYVIDSGITQPLVVARVDKVTTQVVEGSLTRVDFVVTGSSDSTTIKCHSEVWERPWLNKKEINVTCQNDVHRSKRGIVGGQTDQDPTAPQYKALAEESLRKYVVDSGITQPLLVARVDKVTTQVVAGSLTRVDFVVTGSSDSTTIKCHSEVWERPWLNKKEINVTCQNDVHRSKRGIVGGQTDQDPTAPQYKALAEESLRKYVVDSGITQPLLVARVDKVTTQVVAGLLTRVDFVVTGSSDSTTIKCHSEVWERPWLNKKEINVTCQNDVHRSKRGIVGGQTDQDPTAPQYKALAEESLRKYVVDSGITQPLLVARVDKVTTQVVAGSLTRVDFVVTGSSDSTTIKCHSEVWERPWLNKKEINVTCQNGVHRSKRGIVGGQTDQDPTAPQYKALAEESLRKYVVDSGITQPLVVARVDKVTTQVVAGSLTRVDFVVTGSSDSTTIKCHSEVWERPWLNKKEINVTCQNDVHRSKRGIPGGLTDEDPTAPQYKALAEESLRKYVVDSGITQPLLVARVDKVTTQVVAGSLTRVDFVVTGSSDSTTIKCHSEVWERPWLNKKEINVTCQNDVHRSKRGIVGGQTDQDPTAPQYKALAEESLRKYVIDSGITQPLVVARVDKVTTQVVEGSLTRVDFVITGSSDSTTIKCHSEVWERPWLNKKEINVTCQNDVHRSKRGIPGGLTDEDPTAPQYKALAEESLRKYVVDSGITQPLLVARVDKVTTQVVAGSLTRVDFVVTGSSDSTTIKCHSEVWERPWLNKKEINVTCQNDVHRSKRGIVGGQTDQDPTAPQYKALAEESLRKYVVDSGITQPLVVARVDKVTTQVVAGSLTRVDFVVTGSSDIATIKCHSEVWERPWLNKKEINVTCQNDVHRSKRGIVGGEQDQDTNAPRFYALAQQSLRKYTKDSGITQPLEVVRIDKVTTQVVAGELTRMNFVVSVNRGSTTIICHSKIFDQGWINHKEIDVSCHDHSHGGINYGFIEQDPSEHLYKAMAEESLRRHVFDSGITEPLKVASVEKVITEAISGMLRATSIEFTASSRINNSNSIKCYSDIWEQPRLHRKDISVSCLPLNGRVKREILMAGRSTGDNLKKSMKYTFLAKEWNRGNISNNNSELHNLRGRGEEEQEPNKPEYKQLAEESLRKLYRKKSTVYHKVLEVQRVVTRVVSGFKYKIDFTAAPTTCSANVSSVRARSCNADDDVILYCHSDIWDRPWLRQKKIDVQCNGPKYENDDFAEYETDNDLTLKPSNPQNNTDEKFMKLADEASEKYLTTSNRKYVHKVTEIISVNENVADGITNIEYSLSPTTCLRNETTNTTSCKLKQPLVVFHCNANIQIRPWLRVEKQITVTCKKNSENKKSKREAVVRKMRQVIEDDDEIDEDTTYYYADRAVQHINDQSSSNNLHKLITIHAIQNSVQMGTLTVRMYIEVAETFCLRHHRRKDLRDCEEMSGLNHRLCLARLWPSPDDELVVRHVSVVCDDEEDFMSITGVNIPELIRISVAVLESPAENKWKLIHQGEPQVIPSLDSRRPFKLNFVVALTNCSKDVNLDKNPFQCYLNPNIPPRNCRSFIWLRAEAKYISNVEAHCTPITPRIRRSALDPENVTLDYSELQSLVRASLEQLEMQSLHRYKQRVLQINSHSTRITSGKVTTIDFDVGYTSCLKYEWVANITSCNFLEHLPRRRCVAQIWERLWIKNGKNIDVNCVDDETPLESHIEFESAEMANELARQALKHIEAKYPHPSKQKVVRIFSLEKQVVAGIHYKMKVEIGFTDCLALSDQKECKLVSNHGLNKFCRVNVWIRPWTDHPPNFRVSCDFQEGTTRDLYHHVQAEHLFYNFLTTYSPSYVNDYSQMQKRFEIFKRNIKKIHELNVHEKGTATYGVTRFTDLTYEEFSTTYMGLKTNLSNANHVPMKQADIPNIKVPTNFDWRDYDAVTEVKDQGSCGSCWAFSVTGNIEGQWKMQSGQLVSLSEQELVDCDKLDDGCNGGLPDNAYRAVEQMGGLELESDYPYEGTDDKCVFNKTLAKVQISSAVNITSNETAMVQWLVHNGPISIGINANAMQFYMGGISHPWKMLCNPTNLDHGVLIVGYGVKEYPLFHKKLPYWIVKNSWGKSWGEQGYYRVYRGDGTCGVNQMASSAVI